MPASSVDTFFACSLMVILIVSAMVSTAKVVQPYLNNLTDRNNIERHRGLAEYILSNTGYPLDWGNTKGTIPTSFGLAATDDQHPYELDLDKVTRLNGNNRFSLSFREVLAALGTMDMSFNIRMRPLFEVSIDLVSSQGGVTNTTYNFQIRTSRSGFPVPAWLQCYVIINTYISSYPSSTAIDGVGSVNATLPNSQNGAALFLVFAKVKGHLQIMSFNAYYFSHNSGVPETNGMFLQLSPLNNVLNVSFQYPSVEISNAYVFTYTYSYNLSQSVEGNQTLEYHIPRLLEICPMILVLNGFNGSISFVEWVAYPQLSLEIGVDFNDLTARSEAVALTYVVSVNSVLYEAIITCRSVQEYYA